MITNMDANRFATHSLRDARVLRILAAALDAAEPGAAVKRYLKVHSLPACERVFALGIGKAALPMIEALIDSIPLERALAITKHASTATSDLLTVMEGGHPVPDARSLAAGESALDFVARLDSNDLLICLISGGGSALMTSPLVPLEDLQALTSALLACGARIEEINTLRRHLDRVKGGGLAKAAGGAHIVSLILSDVINDPLEAIASGPTAPDPTSREEARTILQKYGLESEIPKSVIPALTESSKPNEALFSRVHNEVIASNRIALSAALKQAEREGFGVTLLTSTLQGEARQIGLDLVSALRVATKNKPRPLCLIAGGETTVTLQKNHGIGGRNQELVLSTLSALAELDNAMLISLATDGEDGPTDAAGAVAASNSKSRAEALGLNPNEFLARNDSYRFFAALDDLLKPGPTSTNVNDLIFLFAF